MSVASQLDFKYVPEYRAIDEYNKRQLKEKDMTFCEFLAFKKWRVEWR